MSLSADPVADIDPLTPAHLVKLLEGASLPGLAALARLISTQLHCPLSSLNVLDAHRVHPVAGMGMDQQRPWSRLGSPCAQVVAQNGPLIVKDLSQSAEFSQEPMVSGALQLRFYAGLPLVVNGRTIGTVCAMDTRARDVSAAELQLLKDLSAVASAIVTGLLNAERARLQEARVRTASMASSDWLWETDANGVIQWVSAGLTHHTSTSAAAEVGRPMFELYRPRGDATCASWTRMHEAVSHHAPFSQALAERVTPRGTITVSISGTPVFTRAGQFKGYRGASHHISHQVVEERRKRHADQLLRQAIESFTAGVMISSPDGRVILCNAPWRRRMGVPEDATNLYWPELLRQRIREGYYPAAAGREEAFFDWRMRMFEEEQPQEIQVKTHWVLSTDQRLPDGSIVHFAINISEVKRQAAALEVQTRALADSEARMRSVLRALPDLWFVIDAQGRYLSGPAEHPMLLQPFSHIQGKLLGTELPAHLAHGEREARAQAHASGQIQRFQYELKVEDTLRHFEGRMAPMPEGQTLFLVQDLTDRVGAEERLRISEERWNFALEGAGEGVWDFDLPLRRMYYSRRWKAMLGYEDHEIGHSLDELVDRVHPDDREAIVQALEHYFSSDQDVTQAEFRMRHKEGHDIWILSRGKTVSRDNQGLPLRVVGTHSDITHHKLAADMLREKQAAEAASGAKSQFLSRMSHEIRTPLNAISGFAQLLKLQMPQPGGDSKLSKYVDQILVASRHLMALVSDVLDLQKVEAGILAVQMEDLALLDEVNQCVDMLAPMAAQSGVRLIVQIDPRHRAHADHQRLQQILINLGSNAIKYNRRGGTVTFSSRMPTQSRCRLTIEDTGPGMTERQLGQLFQPFERLGRETSSVDGTGLGLIITRFLIQAMGGTMEIHSQPDVGTKVELELEPSQAMLLSEAAHQTMALNAPTAVDVLNSSDTPLSSPEALHVLYVEDNRINAMLFEEALRPFSQLSLDVAEDGDIALTLVRQRCPDVLVLDAHLPGMSGFEVLKALRAAVPALLQAPAYMCSADAMPDDLARAKAEGFSGYWTKPIDIIKVTEVLCELAEKAGKTGPASA